MHDCMGAGAMSPAMEVKQDARAESNAGAIAEDVLRLRSTRMCASNQRSAAERSPTVDEVGARFARDHTLNACKISD